MKYTIRNFEIDINCSWTRDEQIQYATHFLSRLYNKDRVSILRKHEIPNRTKMNKTFNEGPSIWDHNIRAFAPNPNYDPELRLKAGEEWINAVGFDGILIISLRLTNDDIYSRIKRFGEQCDIRSQLTIRATKSVDLTYGGVVPTKAAKAEIEDELADI